MQLCGCDRFCLPASLADATVVEALKKRGVAYSNKNEIPAELTFKNSGLPRIWTCLISGTHEWEASPDAVVGVVDVGTGCPSCRNKTEAMIRTFVDTLPTMSVVIGGRPFPWLRNPSSGNLLFFDVVVQSLGNVFAVVEVDGLHHFADMPTWNSIADERRELDVLKMRLASEHGIHCIRIVQKEVWHNRFDWRQRLVEALEMARGIQGSSGQQFYIALDHGVYDRHRDDMKHDQ